MTLVLFWCKLLFLTKILAYEITAFYLIYRPIISSILAYEITAFYINYRPIMSLILAYEITAFYLNYRPIMSSILAYENTAFILKIDNQCRSEIYHIHNLRAWDVRQDIEMVIQHDSLTVFIVVKKKKGQITPLCSTIRFVFLLLWIFFSWTFAASLLEPDWVLYE